MRDACDKRSIYVAFECRSRSDAVSFFQMTSMMPDNELGNAVRLARVGKMWTQEQLAREAGVSRATIARLETGASIPHMSSLSAIAAALDLEARDLMVDLERLWLPSASTTAKRRE